METYELVELDTDELGFASTQDDLVQVKIWMFTNDTLELVGTITFHYNFEDYVFKGIVSRKNGRMVLDVWYNTGISDYMLEKIGDDLFVDFLSTKYVFSPEILSDYYRFKRDYPEYGQLKLAVE